MMLELEAFCPWKRAFGEGHRLSLNHISFNLVVMYLPHYL